VLDDGVAEDDGEGVVGEGELAGIGEDHVVRRTGFYRAWEVDEDELRAFAGGESRPDFGVAAGVEDLCAGFDSAQLDEFCQAAGAEMSASGVETSQEGRHSN